MPFNTVYDRSQRAVDKAKKIWIDVDLAKGKGKEQEKDNSKVTLGCKVVLDVALLYSLKVSVTVRIGKELGEHFINVISRKSSAVDMWMIVGP